MDRVQRIMLATPRPEAIGKSDEVFLVNRLQHLYDGLLDDLVLQAPDTQRPLRSVRLRDVCPSGRAGAIAAPVYPLVQVFQLLVEVFPVGPPRHAVDPRRRVTLQCDVATLQKIDGDVMQQRGEPHFLALSRRLAHGVQSARRDTRLGVRTAVAWPPFPSGEALPSTISARGEPPLFDRFIGTMPSSDSSSACMLIFGHRLHEPVRHAVPDAGEASQVPCKGRLHMHGVSDCARLLVAKPFAAGGCCLLVFELDRHLGIRPVSQLDTQPVVSPVNASS
jgi:hypothetical protein